MTRRAERDLLKDVESGRLSHAYIVFGADTVAIDRLFHEIARKAVCETGRGCGHCTPCTLVDEGSHPDVNFYSGADKISVETINGIIDSTYQKGTMGKIKLYFITEAENLTPAVQNKMLKTFEEPPENVTFFLGCASDSALLPTVRSRAKKFYIEPYSERELTELLIKDGEDDETAAKIAATAAGSLTRALSLAGDEKYLQLFEDAQNVLLNLKKSSEIAEYMFRDLFSKENAAMTLDFMEIILSDVMAVITSADHGFGTARAAELRTIGQGWSAAGLAAAIEKINLARKKRLVNIPPVSVAEGLLFDILEARYKWQ